MVVEKNNKVGDYKFKKGNLNFAVVGHVEWINFLKVDQLPKPGVISHCLLYTSPSPRDSNLSRMPSSA